MRINKLAVELAGFIIDLTFGCQLTLVTLNQEDGALFLEIEHTKSKTTKVVEIDAKVLSETRSIPGLILMRVADAFPEVQR